MSKDYDGAFVDDDEYFADGTPRVDWKQVTLSLDDTTGKIYVCGKTYEQSVEAEKCYNWLEKNAAKPEPKVTHMTDESYAELRAEDRMYQRLRDRQK